MIKITIVGYGRVGKKLFEIFEQNPNIDCTLLSSKRRTGIKNTINNYNQIQKDSLVFLCVPDDKINEVSKKIGDSVQVVHCSGSTPLDALSQKTKGVFYPLQSFGSGTIKESNIPILLESNDKELLEKLKTMANFTNKLAIVNSSKRLLYHLNAVILNNFTNYLMVLSNEFAVKNELDFNLFNPLIEETIHRIKSHNPKDVQTGPAARGDKSTIKSHLKLLNGNIKLKVVYQLLSEMIENDFSKK